MNQSEGRCRENHTSDKDGRNLQPRFKCICLVWRWNRLRTCSGHEFPLAILGIGAEELVVLPKICNCSQLSHRQWLTISRGVVQELALAKHVIVHCGQVEVPWDDFAVAVSLFMKVFDRAHTLVRESIQERTAF